MNHCLCELVATGGLPTRWAGLGPFQPLRPAVQTCDVIALRHQQLQEGGDEQEPIRSIITVITAPDEMNRKRVQMQTTSDPYLDELVRAGVCKMS